MAAIAQFLASSDWTKAEQIIIKWQFRLLGDFQTALMGAICAADEGNLARLALGFPQHVAGYIAWNQGDLGTRLRAAGLEI